MIPLMKRGNMVSKGCSGTRRENREFNELVAQRHLDKNIESRDGNQKNGQGQRYKSRSPQFLSGT